MNYSKLDLKIGLEIHQQISSKHKLFCKCPIQKTQNKNDKVMRKFRPVAGEQGEFDITALYEFLKGKTFIYKNDYNNSCLVELDEAPPHEMNKEALEETIKVCKFLNCKIVDEIHVMRKNVIDGSVVCGFQRTSIIGYNGFLKTSFGKIKIQTICLEEDSSNIISKEKTKYRLDRLGIPLIEIVTDASIKTPEQAKEVAEKIGLLLRSLNVIRGIGSIRQDVNISIKNGQRIEIKGFQELNKLPILIKTEINRQLSLLEIKKELQKRGLKKINTKPKDVTDLFKDVIFLKDKNFLKNKKIFTLVLEKFDGLLKKQCGDRTFGKELSSYVSNGLIHSDENLSKYNLTKEFLKKTLNLKNRDLVLIIIGENPIKDMNSILERIVYCLKGVPKETRVSDSNGSKFIRPLPGNNRMYPETDVAPITTEKLISIKLPKTLIEKENELKKNLPHDMAKQIIRTKFFTTYEELVNKTKIEPIIVANMILSYYKDLHRKNYDIDKINKNDIIHLLNLIKNKKIDKKALYDSLLMLAQGKSIKEIEIKFEIMNENDIKKIILSIIEKNPDKNQKSLMGIIMNELKGRASGKVVFENIKKIMNETHK